MAEVYDWQAVVEQEYKDTRNKAWSVFSGMLVGSAVILSAVHFSQSNTAEAINADTQEATELLDNIADEIVGENVNVFCFLPQGYEKDFEQAHPGYILQGAYDRWYSSGSGTIFIRPERCEDISQYYSAEGYGFSSELIDSRALYSIFIFSHELAHALGKKKEGDANCGSVTLMPEVATYLSMNRLTSAINPRVYVQSLPMAPEYHEAGC